MKETFLSLAFIASMFVVSITYNSPGFFVGSLVGMIFVGCYESARARS